tara:strand:+ start:3448 stop:4197 length:750 start_codon:yes stop_codon:yes gene_type:complete
VIVLEIGGLIVILAVTKPDALHALAPATASTGYGSIMGVVVITFFASIGFEDMVIVAEEVKDPERTMPRAIIATLVLTTLLYVSLSWVSVRTAGVEDLAASQAPLGLVFERANGWSATTFSAVAALATMNGALVLLIMASWVFYGLARQGSLPSALAQVWPVTSTPVHATLLAAGLVLACALFFPIERLAQASALLNLAFFAGVNVALGVIKKRQPLGPDRFRVPGWWPWIAVLAATGVMIGEALRLLG